MLFVVNVAISFGLTTNAHRGAEHRAEKTGCCGHMTGTLACTLASEHIVRGEPHFIPCLQWSGAYITGSARSALVPRISAATFSLVL